MNVLTGRAKSGQVGSESSRIVVGVDDRPGMVRISIDGGTQVVVAAKCISSGESAVAIPGFVTESDTFAITPGSFEGALDFEQTHGLLTARHRVLLNYALLRAGLGGERIHLVTTLPPLEYYSGRGGRENLDLIAIQSGNVRAQVRSLRDGPPAHLVANYICPQGLCAWIDYTIGPTGLVKQAPRGIGAVIEVGENSSACTSILPGHGIDRARTGAVDIGSSDLRQLLAIEVRRRFGVTELGANALNSALRTGFLRVGDNVFELRDAIVRAQQTVADEMMTQLHRRLGSVSEFSRIIFVGAGASLIPQLRVCAPNADVPTEQEFAGARGLVKYVRYVM